jgi:hypothetical protein
MPRKKKGTTEDPQVTKAVRLRDAGPRIKRRDLLRAAAALGIGVGAGTETGAEAASASKERRGTLSYVVCNKGLGEPVRSLAFSPIYSYLAAVGAKGALRLWKTLAFYEPVDYGPKASVTSVAWGPDDLLAVVHAGDKLAVYDLRERGERVLEVRIRGIRDAAFSPDGTRLAVRTAAAVQEIDRGSGRLIRDVALDGPEPRVGGRFGYLRYRPHLVVLAGDREVLLADLDAGTARPFSHPVAGFTRLVMSANLEKVLYVLDPTRGQIVTFPEGDEWRSVPLPPPHDLLVPSPTVESACWLVGGRVFGQDWTEPGAQPESTSSDAGDVSAVTAATEPGVFAWGDDEGRIVVGTLRNRSWQKQIAVDPKLAKLAESAPEDAKLRYPDCVCTCNSVEVTGTHNDRVTQSWDSTQARWVTSTQPCGTPIPPGAVCLCNCVSAPRSVFWRQVCSCNLVCTCDTVCTCNPQGGGTVLTYWY